MGGISTIKVAKLCACFNRRLATMSVEVTVRFTALLSVFDPAQGPPRGEDDGHLTYKPRFNSAAWVVPGAMHVRKSALVATGDLNQKAGSRLAAGLTSSPPVRILSQPASAAVESQAHIRRCSSRRGVATDALRSRGPFTLDSKAVALIHGVERRRCGESFSPWRPIFW